MVGGAEGDRGRAGLVSGGCEVVGRVRLWGGVMIVLVRVCPRGRVVGGEAAPQPRRGPRASWARPPRSSPHTPPPRDARASETPGCMTPRSPALAASLGLVPRRRRSMPSGGPTDALAPPPRGTPPGHGLVPPLPTRRPRRPSSLAQGPCTYRLRLTTGLRASTGWSFWVAASVRERRRGCQCWGTAYRVEALS